MSERDGISIELSELFSGYAQIDRGLDCSVSGIALDSRKCRKGFVYFALQGAATHGLYYLDDVINAGVAAVVVDADDGVLNPGMKDKITSRSRLILIPRLRETLGFLAARYFGNSRDKLTIVGVTGTDGKTSVTHFISHALNVSGRNAGVLGTIHWGVPGNYRQSSMTTPDAIEVHRQLYRIRKAGATHVCMEVSSHALDQGRVNGIEFEVAVLTNLARDHLDYHKTHRNYAKAKKRLFEWKDLPSAIINADDRFGRELIESVSDKVQTTSYGLYNEPDILAESVELGKSGLALSIKYDESLYHLNTPLIGSFNAYNVLAAFGALNALGLSSGEVSHAISRLKPVEGRMERFAASGKANVVIDYAHTPQALEYALRSLKEYCKGDLWCVFGCGGDRDPGKRAQMAQAAEKYASRIILTNDNPRTEDPESIVKDVISGFSGSQDVRVILERRMAIKASLDAAQVDDWVLIAGKGHEDYQIFGDRRIAYSDRAVVKELVLQGSNG